MTFAKKKGTPDRYSGWNELGVPVVPINRERTRHRPPESGSHTGRENLYTSPGPRFHRQQRVTKRHRLRSAAFPVSVIIAIHYLINHEHFYCNDTMQIPLSRDRDRQCLQPYPRHDKSQAASYTRIKHIMQQTSGEADPRRKYSSPSGLTTRSPVIAAGVAYHIVGGVVPFNFKAFSGSYSTRWMASNGLFWPAPAAGWATRFQTGMELTC